MLWGKILNKMLFMLTRVKYLRFGQKGKNWKLKWNCVNDDYSVIILSQINRIIFNLLFNLKWHILCRSWIKDVLEIRYRCTTWLYVPCTVLVSIPYHWYRWRVGSKGSTSKHFFFCLSLGGTHRHRNWQNLLCFPNKGRLQHS